MIFDQNASGYGWMDFFQLLRSKWPVVLLTCSLVLLSGAVIKKRLPPLYEASVRIGLDKPEGGNGPDFSTTSFRATQLNDLARQAAEIRSTGLLSEVIGRCKLSERWEMEGEAEILTRLKEWVRVEELPGERTLILSARDLTPESSADLANAISERFLERKDSEIQAEANARVRRLEHEVKERHEEIKRMETRLVEIKESPAGSEVESEDLRRKLISERYLLQSLEAKHQLAVLEANDTGTLAHLIESAEAKTAKFAAPVWLTLPGLASLGFLTGMLAILLLDGGRTRWNLIANLLNHLHVTIAGFAPLSGVSLLRAKTAPVKLIEGYRELRTRLLRLPAGDCLFINLMPLRDREGLAEMVTNLSCVLADGGKMVLVIDADFRHPRLHRFFDAANHPGLSDYLSGEMRLEETVIKVRRPNLWFMPSGPLHEDPCGLINGRRMGDLIWDMRSRFDFILVVSPSIHEVSDAGALASLADFTALVTPYWACSISQLKKAKLALEAASARLCAVLLTTKLESPEESVPNRTGQPGVVPIAGLRKGSK